jgi:AcrR family transcriptional regulator
MERPMARTAKAESTANGGGAAPGNGRRPRQDNRRRQLLDAAARLFADQGYRATTIRDIAGAIGMLPGSVYYHFPSKHDLLATVYEEGVRRIGTNVDAAVAELSEPWARLEAACMAHLGTLLDRSDYAQVLIRVIPTDAGEAADRLVVLRDLHEARFAALIDDLPLPAAADRRRLRLMLIGALNWAQVWYRPGGDDPASVARDFVRYLRQAPATWDRQETTEETK